MDPKTFAHTVHKLAPRIERECAAETVEAISRLVQSVDDEVSRDDAIANTTELFLRLLPRRPAGRR
jgi:hypothetical protein